ncbi:hypothetical protein Z948_1464 [Sulfitobacter donghicola DSW-25 = KCTC 12864 = JCM 14565]|nr:hypothetical protein Z948_1464 [Sulfitobacter donghicola DSW-25 = KCTC 12864 = JCM 14565]
MIEQAASKGARTGFKFSENRNAMISAQTLVWGGFLRAGSA